jgi:ubiquinone/menaquinone biosynthesis C-methylase UbiE
MKFRNPWVRPVLKARSDEVTSLQLKTRGIRVDHRIRSVDIFENLLSFGSRDAILRRTLAAADLKPGEHLLDVGCGSGRLVTAAAREGVCALGIDATPGMIDLARQRAERQRSSARFDIAIAEAMPLPNGWADAVTSSFFFHHLPSDLKAQALNEMWRVLKPGGRLIITDYARPRRLLGWVASSFMRLNFYEYVRSQLGGELEDLIEAENMGPAEIAGIFLGYITVFRTIKPKTI